MALPESGVISFNDINVELGNSGTALLTLADALSTMGNATNPDTMQECYGYDDSPWGDIGNGWLETTSMHLNQTTYVLTIYLDNHSQVHTQSETLYWRLKVGSSQVDSGNVASGTVSVNSTASPTDNSYTAAPVDGAEISYDNSNWQSVSITVV